MSVSYANFVDEGFQILSLFDNPDDIDKEERLQSAIDSIRKEFGFTTIQKQLLYRRHLGVLLEVSLLVDTRLGIRWLKMIDRSYLPFQSAREHKDGE